MTTAWKKSFFSLCGKADLQIIDILSIMNWSIIFNLTENWWGLINTCFACGYIKTDYTCCFLKSVIGIQIVWFYLQRIQGFWHNLHLWLFLPDIFCLWTSSFSLILSTIHAWDTQWINRVQVCLLARLLQQCQNIWQLHQGIIPWHLCLCYVIGNLVWNAISQ